MQENQVSDEKITSAGVLVIATDGKILAFARKGDLTKIGLPAGKREAGEDVATCAVRELEEETGLKVVLPTDTKSFTYCPDDKQRQNLDEYCTTYIFHSPQASTEIILKQANLDANGDPEGYGLWLEPHEFIGEANSAFLDYNTHLLQFAGLI